MTGSLSKIFFFFFLNYESNACIIERIWEMQKIIRKRIKRTIWNLEGKVESRENALRMARVRRNFGKGSRSL